MNGSATIETDKASPWSAALFTCYFLILGLGLLYLAFVVWPPDFDYAGRLAKVTDQRVKDVPSDVVFFDDGRKVQGIESGPSREKGATIFTAAATPPKDASNSTESIAEPNSSVHGALSSPASAQPSVSLTGASSSPAELEGGIRLHLTYDQRLLLMVIIIGALGSYIHATTSFADYVGNKQFVRSWLSWYLLRPLVGAPTALLLYFVVRAGFLTAQASGGDVNRFGIAAIAGLAGMFSLKAADKLKELFDTLFKTDVKRKDSLQTERPVPTISGFQPDPLARGATDLKILGAGFLKESVVTINGYAKPGSSVQFANATELIVTLVPDDTGVHQLEVEVFNQPPGGGKARKTVEVR
jgi:hypothetical protein